MKRESSEQISQPRLKVEFASCPVRPSMEVLGRKWTLVVIRNIGVYRKQRFNEMLNVTPGLTKRVLSMRLKELERSRFIEVVERGRNYLKWDLTEKGRDVLPTLMTLIQLGSKWYADRLFSDKKPRKLEEVFDERYIRKIMGPLAPPQFEHSIRNVKS